jgi:hypothetical protein
MPQLLLALVRAYRKQSLTASRKSPIGISRGWPQTRGVVLHGNTRDPLTFQQQRGVALLVAEKHHQDVSEPDFVLAAGRNVEHGALKHAVEAGLRAC